jgi:hypothetical protein
MSLASFRVNAMLGIFGCGSSKKKANFSALKPKVPAICLKRRSVSIRLALVWRDHMTGRAPSLRQALTVISVGGERRRHNERS